MFTEKQQALRCMIYKTHDHDSIPQIIPREKLKEAHRFLSENFESQHYIRFVQIMDGKIEPTDDEVSSKLAVYEWYVSPWYSGRRD